MTVISGRDTLLIWKCKLQNSHAITATELFSATQPKCYDSVDLLIMMLLCSGAIGVTHGSLWAFEMVVTYIFVVLVTHTVSDAITHLYR